jgi:hypothetical protein
MRGIEQGPFRTCKLTWPILLMYLLQVSVGDDHENWRDLGMSWSLHLNVNVWQLIYIV